jgi:hypothetical protein
MDMPRLAPSNSLESTKSEPNVVEVGLLGKAASRVQLDRDRSASVGSRTRVDGLNTTNWTAATATVQYAGTEHADSDAAGG